MFRGRRRKTVSEEFLTPEQIAEGYCMAEYDHCLCLYRNNVRVCIFSLGATRSLVQKVIESESERSY